MDSPAYSFIQSGWKGSSLLREKRSILLNSVVQFAIQLRLKFQKTDLVNLERQTRTKLRSPPLYQEAIERQNLSAAVAIEELQGFPPYRIGGKRLYVGAPQRCWLYHYTERPEDEGFCVSRIEADSIRLSRYEMDKSRPTQYRTLTREEVSALDRQVRRNIWVRGLEVWGEKKTRVLSPWRSRPIWVVLLPSQKKILVQQTSPHRWTVMSRQDAQQNGISSDLIAELFPDDVISSP